MYREEREKRKELNNIKGKKKKKRRKKKKEKEKRKGKKQRKKNGFSPADPTASLNGSRLRDAHALTTSNHSPKDGDSE